MLCIAVVKLWKLHLLTSQAYSSSGFVLFPYQGGVGLPNDNPVWHIRDSLLTNLQAGGAVLSCVHSPGFSWVQERGQCVAVVSTYFCDPSGSSIAEVLKNMSCGSKECWISLTLLCKQHQACSSGLRKRLQQCPGQVSQGRTAALMSTVHTHCSYEQSL